MAANPVFNRPTEAPIYYPSEEEFSSPLLYIQTIKAEAEKFGICKIVPPKSFKPPFSVKRETFKFKARYQRLSDLDGFSRSRHSFTCMLRRFWTDQGWPAEMTYQTVGERVVDWYDLYIAVHRLGGFKAVCSSSDGWVNVARCLGISYGSFPSAIKELRQIYEKNLLPYDDFRAQVEVCLGKDHASLARKGGPVNKSAGCRRLEKKEACDDVPVRAEAPSASAPQNSRCKTPPPGEPATNGAASPSKSTGEGSPDGKEKRARARRSTSQVCYSEMICEVCRQTDEYDNLKFCEKCESTYHLRCVPASVRKGNNSKLWICPRCMRETYDGLRACHTFGFETSSALYTLDEFKRKADEFKRNHFGSLNVGLQTVEQEFWRLLGDPLGETIVEYGADLHRGEMGSSGFPTEQDRSNLRESEREYIDHPWNLNKLPDNELSILKHITAQISGMKIPWMYVGMAFSAFCWHTEDHWSASINYLHMGEPKTWYGVPGNSAEVFETAFKQLVPVLTESNPDLLHQLVTHMNPSVLQACGVPVYRTDQRQGEYIVTFPRAYHAGFNQGFNFAEAVNFCLADWIPHGRLSINHYSNCKRELVFSHDELICCMADQAQMLHQTIAKACHKDFQHMVDEETAARQSLIDKGIVLDDEPTLFEFMDDHERSCSTCHTTLFLSAVQCVCSNEKLACWKHAEQLCHCDLTNKRLLYRYTIDDLNVLLQKLLKRSEEVDAPDAKPNFAALTAGSSSSKRIGQSVDVKAVKKPRTGQDAPMDFFGESYDGSGSAELKAVMKMASELVSPQTITRGRDAGDISPAVKRWKIADVEGLITSLQTFPGTSKEVNHIREYLRKYYALGNEIRVILQTKPEEIDYDTLRRVFDQARSTNIQIDSLEELQTIVQQTEFREKVCTAINDTRTTIATLAEVLQSSDEILIRNEYVEDLIGSITRLIDEGRNLEIDAESIVNHGRRVTLSEAKALVDRADSYPIELKNIDLIRDGIETMEKLADTLEALQKNGQRIHIEKMKTILEDDIQMNFHSGSVGVILEMYKQANQFLEKLEKLFFGNVSSGATPHAMTLLEVLTPRQVNMVRHSADMEETEKEKEGEESNGEAHADSAETESKSHPFDLDLHDQYSSTELASLFERASWDEQVFYEHLRESNCLKSALDSDIREESAQLRKELRWCVCGTGQLGTMIQCDSCFDWFHVSCTRMAEFMGEADGSGEFGLVRHLVESIQFMCDICQRGVRPALEHVKKLFYEYRDVQRFIIVPEMDLTAHVINRAEKWRRSAMNIITELPTMVHLINNIQDRDSDLRVRRRTRDAILALLLEGNLLEVKLPEWLFLYDFVHENFRKDRQEDEATCKMLLPARVHGGFPVAVDMISPLFRQLSRGADKSLVNNGGPADVVEDIGMELKLRNGRNGEGKLSGRKRTPSSKKLAMDLDEEYEPEPEPIRRRKRQQAAIVPRDDAPVVNAFRSSPVKHRSRRQRPQNGVGSSEHDEDEQEDAGLETCFVCQGSFPPHQLPSTIYQSRIVAMCINCKNTKNGAVDLKPQIKEEMDEDDDDDSLAKRNSISPRRNRGKSS